MSTQIHVNANSIEQNTEDLFQTPQFKLTKNTTKPTVQFMAEVLDAPPFTDPNKAREAGLRSAELRKQQATENETLRALLAIKPISDLQPALPVNEEVNRQIALANELITLARERINDKDFAYCEHCERSGISDKDKAALIREMRGLMEHLCRLHSIPQAPTTKANPRPARRTDPLPEPTPIAPAQPGPSQAQPGPV